MSDANQDQPSLRQSFADAEILRRRLESQSSSNTATYQDAVKQTVTLYQQCQELAEQIHLWSVNETMEDVSSGDLQYFLILYRLASLTLKINEVNRKATLLQSREQFERFLHLLDQYDCLSKADGQLFETFREDRNHFSTAPTRDAASRRNMKITRFKAEKTLKDKLERDPTALANDDAAMRELHMTNLRLCTHDTFQELEGIAKEVDILAMAPSDPSQATQNGLRDDRVRNQLPESYSERLDRPLSELLANGRAGPILSSDGKPLKPFTLLDSRQRLQQGVFRPDHSLPTMTIDEYLEEERRRGGMIEGGGEASMRRSEPNEDDEEKADAETMKQRAWDDYKDANPRGSGNTMNMG